MAVFKVKKDDTYDSIARRAGVTTGAVYRYFKGKTLHKGMKYNTKKLQGMAQGGQAYSISQGMNPWGLSEGVIPDSAYETQAGTDMANSYLASLGLSSGAATGDVGIPGYVSMESLARRSGIYPLPSEEPTTPYGEVAPTEGFTSLESHARRTGIELPSEVAPTPAAPETQTSPIEGFTSLESHARRAGIYPLPSDEPAPVEGFTSLESLARRTGIYPLPTEEPTTPVPEPTTPYGGRYGYGGGYGRGGGRRSGGGGGYGAQAQWGGDYTVEGAPNWWRGQAPTGGSMSPTAAYAAVVNAMIPFLSPEDQRSMANNLARLLPDVFGSYANVGAGAVGIPTDMTPGLVGQYTSAERAEGMLASLEAMRAASTYEGKEFGPGFTYFENLARILKDYGGTAGSPQTRQQYSQLMAALDPIMGELQGETLAAFGPAAQAVTQPFFSAGSLVPVNQLPDGSWIFGDPNVSLF